VIVRHKRIKRGEKKLTPDVDRASLKDKLSRIDRGKIIHLPEHILKVERHDDNSAHTPGMIEQRDAVSEQRYAKELNDRHPQYEYEVV
jgi:hypothetical protein